MKGTVFAVAGLAGVASAFVPPSALPSSAVRARANTARMAVNEILGADVETKGVWDPLGFSKDEDALYRYRAVELKHGRVAMLGALGYLFAELHHPLYDGKVAPGLKAISELPAAAWLQIIAAIAVVELTVGKQDTENKAPGDLGFGYSFNPFKNDAEKFADLQLKELKNGRLAMIATAGILVQELVTGQTTFQQLASGHISPFGDGQGKNKTGVYFQVCSLTKFRQGRYRYDRDHDARIYFTEKIVDLKALGASSFYDAEVVDVEIHD